MSLQLSTGKVLLAIARNQLHRLRGGPRRGGHQWSKADSQEVQRHIAEIVGLLAPHVGNIVGSVGLEIGPGDQLGVCRAFLSAGARRMYAVEPFAANSIEADLIVIGGFVEELQLPEPIEFAVSNDVLEHVGDVHATFKRIFQLLKPGGVFVSNIDLRGHNVFNNTRRPLDFLTCSDWLYSLMLSQLATANRVTLGEHVAAARDAGFEIEHVGALARAPDDYLAEVRQHLLPRFRDVVDLDVLQVLIVARKPA
ncbi:MAG: methyltransferase domain-containing protein [Pseudomonadota bacterium]